MKSMSRSLVGIVGAHFVAAELSQRGIVATVTSRNTEGIDVLALQKKHENIYSDNLFYIFVDLKPTNEKR